MFTTSTPIRRAIVSGAFALLTAGFFVTAAVGPARAAETSPVAHAAAPAQVR